MIEDKQIEQVSATLESSDISLSEKRAVLQTILDRDPIGCRIFNTKTYKSRPYKEGDYVKPKIEYVYIPIGVVEYLLDKLFVNWNSENFKYSVEGRSVLATLDLKINCPSVGFKTSRCGAGSEDIKIDDKGYPAANQVPLKFPGAKTSALKNAAQSLGRIFGRGMNRKQDFEVSAKEDPLAKYRD